MKFPIRASGRRKLVAVASAGVLAVGGLVAVSATPAHAQTGCSVDYELAWEGGNGFGANITITNLGAAINGWELTFAFPDGQQVDQGWSADWTTGTPNVTASNLSWNANIPTDGSVSVGFNGSHSGSNTAPDTFFLNGVECDGQTGGPGGDPAIVADPSSLSIQGGDSATVTFTLDEEPESSVTISLSVSGSSAVSIAPSSLTLDGGSWSTGALATVSTTAGPNNASATVTASASGYEDASVSVTRLGDDGGPGPGDRVDNPYAGADVYVNPDWSSAAQAGGAPASVYNQPTGVWLDRIGAIESGSEGNATGLADHLDNAVAQDAANGSTPTVFQVVIYNLPGRDCAALASNGELGPEEIDRYRTEYVDVITEIMGRPEYADLRKVAIIEIDSLPNLVTNVGGEPGATELCDEMLANGNYVEGVGYATGQLANIGAYNYIDAAHHGWIGWDSNFTPTANIICDALNAGGASPADLHGLITNTANYSALQEPHIDTFGTAPDGQQIRQSDWVDWNQYNSELPFAQDFGQEVVGQCSGVDSNLGMLIDTSRNGWGGPDRPDGPSSASELNQFVDESRTDRRAHKGNWCNQAGAGLGERPQANPAAGIDAYVWIKPPGESDGSSELIPVGPENPNGKGFDEMCDPEYEGNPRNQDNPTSALPNAPVSGAWFQAQFDELLANANPPVS